jgi:dolichyl-phosphate-mannose--protein O-mannosyl transferase
MPGGVYRQRMSRLVDGVLSRGEARGDWLMGLFLYAAMLVLVFIRIDRPPSLSFDEAHYVKAARYLLPLLKHENTEHPLFAKETIAFGMLIFGDNPFGWRITGALIMSACVPAVFGTCRMLGLSRMAALFAAFLLMVDNTTFVLARTAMLDTHSVGWFALFVVTLTWSSRPQRSLVAAFGGIVLAGIFLGFAGAAKWMSIINGVLVWFGIFIWRLTSEDRNADWSERLVKGAPQAWPRSSPLLVVLVFFVSAIVAYLAVFWPLFFLKENPAHNFAEYLNAQKVIYDRSVLPLPGHRYANKWWDWPILTRPIWFYFQKNTPTTIEAVFYTGNIVVYWGGILAAIACLGRGIVRLDRLLLALVLAWLAFWLTWAVIPKKINFQYYYAPASLLLGPMIAAAMDRLIPERFRGWAMFGFGTVALGVFIWFYPGLSGLAVPEEDWKRWLWMKNWS